MKPPRYEDTTFEPLTSDALIEQRVGDLVGRAISRQLWFLFLDEEEIQLPMLIPLDRPERPTAQLTTVVESIHEAVDVLDAASVIVVIERHASEILTPIDIEWARAISDSCTAQHVRLRGLLLSHRRGVRWIPPDAYA
ncbi:MULTISPECIES: hypothetical protein [unclassified Salinibacterium]|uniref:hypothetical protein n=1 Tax=unclassified Salinibacterium TaxID=2632331 RepID=UPI0014209889|nr:MULTISPECIES: hypothetical protein [unclassified Salinibacterium]